MKTTASNSAGFHRHIRNRIVRWLMLPLAAWFTGQALAEEAKLTLAPPSVVVAPLIANTGVERTITVSGVWPDACPPQNATLLPAVPGDNTISIKLIQPQTFVACAQVITSFSSSVTYTPTAAGTQRIVATVNDGRHLATGQLITQSADKARASTDLTGTWYNATTNGSGLALFHSHAGSDVMTGAWYVYDTAGKPYWFLIQNGVWADANIFYGDLMQSSAPGGNCLFLPACARTMLASTRVGAVRIEIQEANRIRVSIGSGGPPLPEVNFETVFVAERLQF
jgi:hypothetical protein